MHQWLKKWTPLAVLIVLIIGVNLAVYLEYQDHLRQMSGASAPGFSNYALGQLHHFREDAHAFTMAHPVTAALAFALLYAVVTALSLPFALLMSLLGGFLFGKFLGTLVIVTGATTGATVIFLIARTSVGETLKARTGRWYDTIANNIQDNAIGYLLFLRLVPLFPFFVVNVVPAFFNISTAVYVATTFFGIIPGAFVYANLGEELGQISKLSDLVSQDAIIAFTLLGILALLPGLYKNIKHWRRKTKNHPPTKET